MTSSPIEVAIQLGIATVAILFVYRGVFPLLIGTAEQVFKFRRR